MPICFRNIMYLQMSAPKAGDLTGTELYLTFAKPYQKDAVQKDSQKFEPANPDEGGDDNEETTEESFAYDIVKLASGTAASDVSAAVTLDADGSNFTFASALSNTKNFNIGVDGESYFQIEGRSGDGMAVGNYVQIETPFTVTENGYYSAALYAKAGNNRGKFDIMLVPVADGKEPVNMGNADLYASSNSFRTVSVGTESVYLDAGEYKIRFLCTAKGNLTTNKLILTQTNK